MINPSVEDLTKSGYNRYTLCIAASKIARKITDEIYEAAAAESRDDKSAPKKSIVDEKPVNTAIKQLYRHCFDIIMPEDGDQNNN
ncbi:MAG: DNA-directed RNA polymerase subunit omega [Clostridia bacterium]|nr:DNA-directed RNA polymerase subunit omega [Clostridia bacterium]